MAWVIQDNTLTNTDFIDLPDTPFVGDSPYTMWRIVQNVNKGKPFSPLMIPILESVNAYIGDTRAIAMYIGDTPVVNLL